MEKLKLFINNLDKKQKILSIVALSLLGIFFIVVIVGCLLPKPTSEPDGEDNSSLVVDYDQTVTNADGSSFDNSFRVGSSEQYAIRFPDLICRDGCKNISSVRMGNQLLKNGLDYEVKEGSVIIVLLKRLLASLKTGDYNLTFEYNDGETTKKIGVNIKIENETPTCNEDQVLTDGECVTKEKPETSEDDSSSNGNGESSSNNNGSDSGGSSNNSNSNGNNSSNEGSNNSSSNNNSGSNNNTPQNPDNTTPTTPDTPSTPDKPDTPVTPEEPTPSEPEEPETPVHTAEFNLNDGYNVEIVRIRWLQTDDVNSCYTDEMMICPEIVFGWCAVQKNEVEIKKVFFGGGETLMTEAQYNAKQQEATNNGYQSVEGYGIVPALDEDNCDLCSLSCDRW